jgi:hypothetical protein
MPNGDIRFAKQRDAVGARHRATGLLLVFLEEPSFDALAIVGTRRRIGFGDEHVAIRQHMQPSRVVQTAREGDDGRAVSDSGSAIRRPPFRGDDVDDGDQRSVGRRQDGIGPGAIDDDQLRACAASHGDSENERDNNGARPACIEVHGVLLDMRLTQARCPPAVP